LIESLGQLFLREAAMTLSEFRESSLKMSRRSGLGAIMAKTPQQARQVIDDFEADASLRGVKRTPRFAASAHAGPDLPIA
jgi:hypothetical protein